MTFRSDDQRRAMFAQMHTQKSVMRGVTPRKSSFWASRNPLAQGSSSGGKKHRGGAPQRGPQDLEQGMVLRALQAGGFAGSSILKRAGFTTGFTDVKRTMRSRRQDRSRTRQALKDLAIAGGIGAVAAVPLAALSLRTKAGQKAALWAARHVRPLKLAGGLTRSAENLTQRTAETAVRSRIHAVGQAAGRYVDKGFAKLFGSEVVPAQTLRQLNEPALGLRGMERAGQRGLRAAAAKLATGSDAALARQRRLLLSVEASPIGLVDRFDLRARRWFGSKLAPQLAGGGRRMTPLQRIRAPISTDIVGEASQSARLAEQQQQWGSLLRRGGEIKLGAHTYTRLKSGTIRRRNPFVSYTRAPRTPKVTPSIEVPTVKSPVPPARVKTVRFQPIYNVPKVNPKDDIRRAKVFRNNPWLKDK